MLIGQILLGLPILGVLIFIHELGHYAVARSCGIAVEVFSLGMGPRIWGFTRKGTEYRISAIPLGGYCRMSGEKDMSNALEKGLPRIDPSPGSYYAASPLKRIAVVLAGPAFNFILALLLMTISNLAGFEYQSIPPRLVLYSEVKTGTTYPADLAGLKTGDIFVSIQGKPIQNYRELYESIATNARVPLECVIDRGGQKILLTVTPELQKDSGAGKIGILPWQDPVLVKGKDQTLPEGFHEGDVVTGINGIPARHVVELENMLEQASLPLEFTVMRNGVAVKVPFKTEIPAAGEKPRFEYATQTYDSAHYGLFEAIAQGFVDCIDTLGLAIRSIGNLFSGLNPQSAVSGPLRISYLAGESTLQSFAVGFSSGMHSILEFMALLSIALFFGNLLPIPALDGGQCILFIIELITRRPLSPKLIQNYQLTGVVLVLGLTVFAFYGDIVYFVGLIWQKGS